MSVAERRRWIDSYRQRLVWGLTAVALTLAVLWATLAGLRLHHAVLIERQTLRTQRLAQRTLELQNFEIQAEAMGGVGSQLSASRRDAVAAADAAFASVERHGAAEAARLRNAYDAYLAASTHAFGVAAQNAGRTPPAMQRRVQRLLGQLESEIGDEVALQAAESDRVNPSARFALIAGASALGLVIILLAWQFELERRAGRIDRDNAARAEELIRLRDEFVAVVSHELRTPLTSIIGYLELISDDGTENLTEDQQSYLAVVLRSTQRLVELVGDLLLVAEAERAPLALELSDVDVATLVEHTAEAARPAADARGVELAFYAGSSGTLRGDPTRLGQMLDNLVSNAVKFTPSGGRVSVRAVERDGCVVFEISDTGEGIPAADRTRLFEPFFRSRQATARAVPGTGLGLTITKAIVDAHHGTIEIDSAPHIGTTFRVRIPARRRVAAEAPQPVT